MTLLSYSLWPVYSKAMLGPNGQCNQHQSYSTGMCNSDVSQKISRDRYEGQGVHGCVLPERKQQKAKMRNPVVIPQRVGHGIMKNTTK